MVEGGGGRLRQGRSQRARRRKRKAIEREGREGGGARKGSGMWAVQVGAKLGAGFGWDVVMRDCKSSVG